MKETAELNDKLPAQITTMSQIIFLATLVEQMVTGKLRVPAFTDDPERWHEEKQEEAVRLLDSVARGLPIGTIVVWETHRTVDECPERIAQATAGHNTDARGGISYLIDGIRRMDTLASALSKRQHRSAIDWRIHYDLDACEFVAQPASEKAPSHFPVAALLSTATTLTECGHILAQTDDADLAKERTRIVDGLAIAFRNYQLPLVRVSEIEIGAVRTVVDRLHPKATRRGTCTADPSGGIP